MTIVPDFGLSRTLALDLTGVLLFPDGEHCTTQFLADPYAFRLISDWLLGPGKVVITHSAFTVLVANLPERLLASNNLIIQPDCSVGDCGEIFQSLLASDSDFVNVMAAERSA